VSGTHRLPCLQEASPAARLSQTEHRGNRPLVHRAASRWRRGQPCCDELTAADGVRGCRCLGYPSTRPAKPCSCAPNTCALRRPPCPGGRNGTRSVAARRWETYSLSPQVQLRWIPSGDHSSCPPQPGHERRNWATAGGAKRFSSSAAAQRLRAWLPEGRSSPGRASWQLNCCQHEVPLDLGSSMPGPSAIRPHPRHP